MFQQIEKSLKIKSLLIKLNVNSKSLHELVPFGQILLVYGGQEGVLNDKVEKLLSGKHFVKVCHNIRHHGPHS